jgi:hypothetical protein
VLSIVVIARANDNDCVRIAEKDGYDSGFIEESTSKENDCNDEFFPGDELAGKPTDPDHEFSFDDELKAVSAKKRELNSTRTLKMLAQLEKKQPSQEKLLPSAEADATTASSLWPSSALPCACFRLPKHA